MCFSAEVSFVSAALLAGVGILTLRQLRNFRFLLIALIPILFGLQQLAEGFVWLSLAKENAHKVYSPDIFLFFAFLVWPIWMPFSILYAEKEPCRRIFLSLCLILGIGLSLYYLYLGRGMISVSSKEHIIYFAPVEGYPFLYLTATLLPTVISSLSGLWIVGVAMFFGFLISYIFLLEAFVSVWCFFAAITSILLYFILRRNT